MVKELESFARTMKAATKGVEFSKEKDANIIDTQARVWFWKHDYQKALELAPRHLSALLQKGAHQEDAGDLHNAARTYQSALACIPPGTEPAPHLREAVGHARQLVEKDLAALSSALEAPLAAIRARHGGSAQGLDHHPAADADLRSALTHVYDPSAARTVRRTPGDPRPAQHPLRRRR